MKRCCVAGCVSGGGKTGDGDGGGSRGKEGGSRPVVKCRHAYHHAGLRER